MVWPCDTNFPECPCWTVETAFSDSIDKINDLAVYNRRVKTNEIVSNIDILVNGWKAFCNIKKTIWKIAYYCRHIVRIPEKVCKCFSGIIMTIGVIRSLWLMRGCIIIHLRPMNNSKYWKGRFCTKVRFIQSQRLRLFFFFNICSVK